jgi:hypothetical protein
MQRSILAGRRKSTCGGSHTRVDTPLLTCECTSQRSKRDVLFVNQEMQQLLCSRPQAPLRHVFAVAVNRLGAPFCSSDSPAPAHEDKPHEQSVLFRAPAQPQALPLALSAPAAESYLFRGATSSSLPTEQRRFSSSSSRPTQPSTGHSMATAQTMQQRSSLDLALANPVYQGGCVVVVWPKGMEVAFCQPSCRCSGLYEGWEC